MVGIGHSVQIFIKVSPTLSGFQAPIKSANKSEVTDPINKNAFAIMNAFLRFYFAPLYFYNAPI